MTLLGAIRQQRLGVACAITVAVILIGVVRAPIVPIIAGCLIALVLLIRRSWRSDSEREGR